MAFEFLGMQGTILYVFIVGAILLANWKLSKKDFLKFIPLSRQGLGVIGILCMIFVGSSTAWWGYGELAVPGVPDAPTVTPGLLFEAEMSESDANLSFDYDTNTMTAQFYENWVSAAVEDAGVVGGAPGTAITSVEFTITVFRTDLLDIDNATAKIWATVPTFYGVDENASVLYYPIDKDSTSKKYEIAFNPTGVSARDEYNFFTVGRGGSKAIVVTTDLYSLGLQQLDNMDSKDVKIYITGIDTPFTLRFTKIGEQW